MIDWFACFNWHFILLGEIMTEWFRHSCACVVRSEWVFCCSVPLFCRYPKSQTGLLFWNDTKTIGGPQSSSRDGVTTSSLVKLCPHTTSGTSPPVRWAHTWAFSSHLSGTQEEELWARCVTTTEDEDTFSPALRWVYLPAVTRWRLNRCCCFSDTPKLRCWWRICDDTRLIENSTR